MAKLTINRGSTANDGTGDNLRDGANKVNLNFTEIYTAIGDGSTVNGTIKVADDSSTVMTLSANGETIRLLGGTGITSTISGNDLTLAVDGTVLSASAVSPLTNKSIDLTDNTITGTTAEFNTALTDNDFATLAGTEALTNKNLSSATNTFPTISIKDDASTIDTVALGETITFEGGSGITTTVTGNKVTFATDGSIVTETSTDTLTNKTISGVDNTITNLSASNITGTFDNTSSGSKIRFNFANVASFPNEVTYEGMFAYDIGGNQAYVADAGGWTKLINENASVGDLSNVNITGVADGQALLWSSAQGRFNPGSVATALIVQEEGSSLSTGADTLNFVGSAVTATGSGTTKTITITGGDVVTDTTPQLGGDLDAQTNAVQDVSYIAHRSPDWTVIKTLTVTVATKTSEHYRFGQGSALGYVIDGHESPLLELSPGVYKFDQSDASNATHPLLFYYDQVKARAYTTNVTTSGTPGSAGAYTQIQIEGSTPTPLVYQCSAHSYMGHGIEVKTGRQARLNITTGTATGDLAGANSGKSFTVLADRSVDDILVFVNGICLVPTTDYVVSGTTLTFDTAPATGAEIQFRYLG
jgi:hypothetical protein